MKFLADMGVSMTIVHNLRESGYDVIHLREEGLQEDGFSENPDSNAKQQYSEAIQLKLSGVE